MTEIERFSVYAPVLSAAPGDPPSSWAIEALVQGEPGALGDVVWLTLYRAVPIGAGLYLAGAKRRLVRNSVAASAAVSVTMIGYAWGRKKGWWA